MGRGRHSGPAKARSDTVTLYHRTSDPAAAKSIVEGGFSPKYRPGTNESYVKENSQYGFFTRDVDAQAGYGEHVVTVKVPKSAVEKDPWSGQYRVKVEDLKGAQFRQYKPRKKRK
ncbi:hypothetical protein SEQ_HALENA_112 [Mycobacterium phage Halena]|uniref:ADP-ribosyltransferase n=5 Tax=Bronvirus TaxID=1623278 RepID=A0A411BPQ6_9CAUD|nr:hypothetical protein KNU44_gp113 [Mycobacterium phage CicholasNage]YP_010114800.1 hypothetical protein KNV76_gp116 [Mycobacterium phage OhShagHennessy]AEZ50783.1 hypothetical protein [Mycobacterium phage Fezzik]ASR86085.1 hypothetical protein SEA_APPLETREE2_111 [Mycobacterium phage Appletree2]AYD82280.1 hypothetical protein SEA_WAMBURGRXPRESS_111 [Mycobacterium phage Wamburgrxpress]AZS12259.1 hypothetical protein SEA_ACQUIRE49_112 [Mycobacterium phage Acquire49]QBP29887.1 hypothetical prot